MSLRGCTVIAVEGTHASRKTTVDVCALDDIVPDRGVAALIGRHQVAVFRVAPDDELFALSNYDPFSKAFVLSRGIVGSKDDMCRGSLRLEHA